jgi:hypothetical protein
MEFNSNETNGALAKWVGSIFLTEAQATYMASSTDKSRAYG